MSSLGLCIWPSQGVQGGQRGWTVNPGETGGGRPSGPGGPQQWEGTGCLVFTEVKRQRQVHKERKKEKHRTEEWKAALE